MLEKRATACAIDTRSAATISSSVALPANTTPVLSKQDSADVSKIRSFYLHPAREDWESDDQK